MNKQCRYCLVATLLAFAVSAKGQFDAVVKPVITTATQLRRLSESGTPYHLEAEFEEKLWNGGIRKGTLVEDALSRDFYRQTIESAGETASVLSTKSVRFTQSRAERTFALAELSGSLHNPLFAADYAKYLGQYQKVTGNGLTLSCYRLQAKYAEVGDYGAGDYCFEGKTGDFRILYGSDGMTTVFSDIQPFGKTLRIPREILLSRDGGVFAVLRIRELRSAPELTKASFVPTPGMSPDAAWRDEELRSEREKDLRKHYLPTNYRDKVFIADTFQSHPNAYRVNLLINNNGAIRDFEVASPTTNERLSVLTNVIRKLKFPPPQISGKVFLTTLMVEP